MVRVRDYASPVSRALLEVQMLEDAPAVARPRCHQDGRWAIKDDVLDSAHGCFSASPEAAVCNLEQSSLVRVDEADMAAVRVDSEPPQARNCVSIELVQMALA